MEKKINTAIVLSISFISVISVSLAIIKSREGNQTLQYPLLRRFCQKQPRHSFSRNLVVSLILQNHFHMGSFVMGGVHM